MVGSQVGQNNSGLVVERRPVTWEATGMFNFFATYEAMLYIHGTSGWAHVSS